MNKVVATPGLPIPRVLLVAIVVAVVLALIAVATSSRSCAVAAEHLHPSEPAGGGVLRVDPGLALAEGRVGLRGAVVLYVVMAGVLWNLFLTGYSMDTRWRTFCCTWSCRCSP